MAVYCLIETHGKISLQERGFYCFLLLFFFLLLIFRTVIMDLVKFVCFETIEILILS